jgi:transcription elongation factor Elf1
LSYRDQVIEYIIEHYSRIDEPPSIRSIIKSVGGHNKKFYDEFPGGIDDAYDAAGVELSKNKNLVRKALSTRSSKSVHELSSRQKYTHEIKSYKEKIIELEYKARLDPSKISGYASEVLPSIDSGLWKKVEILSNGNFVKLYNEAVELSGEYIPRVKREIQAGRSYKDNSQTFQAYIIEITENLLKYALEKGRAKTLVPGKVSELCPECDKTLVYKSNNTIICPQCNEARISKCELCSSDTKYNLDTATLLCSNCNYREIFNESILRELDEEYLQEILIDYIKTGELPARIEKYDILLTKKIDDETTQSTSVKDWIEKDFAPKYREMYDTFSKTDIADLIKNVLNF